MATEKEISKLYISMRQIIEIFADNHFPKDDTLVEKLNNWLQTWLFKQTGN